MNGGIIVCALYSGGTDKLPCVFQSDEDETEDVKRNDTDEKAPGASRRRSQETRAEDAKVTGCADCNSNFTTSDLWEDRDFIRDRETVSTVKEGDQVFKGVILGGCRAMPERRARI